MCGRLSLKELLLAGVSCSSSSLRARGIGEREGVGAGRSVNCCVGASGSGEGGREASESPRKRKGNAEEVAGEVKKVKVESRLANDSWLLEGRLLLWNLAESSHPGSGSNSLDCLAFCDGSVAVCCTVQSLDVGLLGRRVQVNLWTFVPASKHLGKLSNADARSAGCDAVSRLTRTECYENVTLEEISGNERVFSHISNCGGCLEIHSLKLLDEPSVLTAQVPDFPSLCLSPAAANARNPVLESLLENIDTSEPALWARGFLHSISPPFLASFKSSENAPVSADARTLPGQVLQKSVIEDESRSIVQSDSQSTLGFLVELRSCCHHSRCQLKYNNISPGTLSYCSFPEQGVVDAGEDCTVSIYFSGAAAPWRPLLGEMLGDCVAINGLRIGFLKLKPVKEKLCIYVATRTSLVFRIGPPVADANSNTEEAVGSSKLAISNRLQNQPRDRCRHLRGLDGSDDAARPEELRFQLRAPDGLLSYVGKITSIIMEDRLLELDDKVWLLLTHYERTQIHGLRVGARVAVRHAHVMTLKSVSEKVLVLGACLRSHVLVVLHSGRKAGSPISTAFQSRLSKYIAKLPFAWAFWVMHVITSLLCKLQGVYSDKELLGSMKHAGLIRKVLPSMMGTPVTLRVKGPIKDFLLHEQFCLLGDTSASVLLSKIPPLSNFCKHVEMLWFDRISSIWHEGHIKTDVNCEPGARFCHPLVSQTSCYVRNIISGAKLGVVLLGSLKGCVSWEQLLDNGDVFRAVKGTSQVLEVCQSTGKLQLVDATAAFDVIVPDLRSLTNLHCVYQISKYKLVMEGEYKAPDVSAAGKRNDLPSPLSWSSLLKGSILENRTPQSLSYYVKFYLRYAKGLAGLTWPSQLQSHESEAAMDLLSTSDVKNCPADVWKGKEFNVALITHKFPARMKYSPDKENQWAFDVEVVLLPYNLLIHQDNDGCDTTVIPPSQNFNFSSSREQGAIGSPDLIKAHQGQRLEQRGRIETHGHSPYLGNSGCRVKCCVFCLRSGLKKYSVQPSCTLSGSLVTTGCSVETSDSGSFCATVKEHWARLSKVKLQKVVLSVNWRSIEINQVFNTGDWCLLPTLQDKVLPFNSAELDIALKRVEIDAEQSLISLQWKFAANFQPSHADTKNSQQVESSSRETSSPHSSPNLSDSNMELTECATGSEEDTEKINLRRCSSDGIEGMSKRSLSSEPQLVDVVLTLSNTLGNEFREWLLFLKRELIPKTLSISDALQLTSHPVTNPSKSGSNLGEMCKTISVVRLEASSRIFSLQGEVVSIQGKLETIECSDDSITTGDAVVKKPMHPRSSGCAQQQTSLFQLRDLSSNQHIRIQINFDKYVRPLGFGPGAVACFRRILLRRDSNLLVGIPTTDVLIESVEKRLHILSHKSEPLSSDRFCAENINAVDLLNDLICELEPRKKYLKVHCRVVAVQELELEWQISRPLSQRKNSADSLPVQDDMLWDVAVKRGCFIIDDGSAVAECWANGDQAAKFLGLHALAGDLSTFCPSIIGLVQLSSHPSENQAGLGESLPQVLRTLVRRHKRVCVQGEPAQGDMGTASWLMQGIDGDLEETEAMILRLVLEQACQQGPKVVHCTSLCEEDHILKYAEECHRGQKVPSDSTTSTSKPWQNLTWSRTQLFATKVEVLNTWAGLQQLASSFDL